MLEQKMIAVLRDLRDMARVATFHGTWGTLLVWKVFTEFLVNFFEYKME